MMIHRSMHLGLALGLLLLLLPLAACKKKESREPEPEAKTAGAETTRPYVTTEDVKVRSGPGTRYKVIAEIRSNTKVNVAGREGGWLRIVSRQGRPPGYIDQRFAKPMAPEAERDRGAYKTTADISVREGPGLHYKAVAQIPKDTRVAVVGTEGDWLRVESKRGNPPGYIDRRYAERLPE